MPDITEIAYLKAEQDTTDDGQDALLALKANVADVRTAAEQDIIDADQNARTESKIATINSRPGDAEGEITLTATDVGLENVDPNANVRLNAVGTIAYFTTDGSVPGA